MQTRPLAKTEDGRYHWSYDMSLFKNPTIAVLTAKVLFAAGVIVMLFMGILTVIENGFDAEQLLFWGKLSLIMFGIMAGLLVIGYLVYAAVMGGVYSVEFEMDDKCLVHAQTAKQAKKAQGIGTATAVVGALTGKPTTAGIGLASQRTTSTTEFSRVKKVVVKRRTSVIRLRGGGSNEAYADGEDFTFVLEWIRSHVPPDVKWIEK
ncbi:MAG: hypothetical protein IKQ92_12190 [Clostridia bacterium]|nr:hypothetical protein [Clostridia bacterium]